MRSIPGVHVAASVWEGCSMKLLGKGRAASRSSRMYVEGRCDASSKCFRPISGFSVESRAEGPYTPQNPVKNYIPCKSYNIR